MTVMLPFLLLCCAGIIQAEDWEDVGNCGVGLNCGPRCQRLCLIQHNYYRSLHNSPPLKCDPGLAKSAQNWADSNAFDGAVQRSSPTGDLVESISWKKWGWEGMATKEGAIPAAVRSWYSEIKNGYNYSTGEGRGTVTHFKSVVHSHEAHVGCGINIKPGDGTYVVARYSLEPSDKFKLDDFTPLRKVGRRNRPEPQCDLKSGEREHCGNLKSPFVTPDKCIKAGCCYDDMFMKEPALQWHSDRASIWCFKRKDRMMKSKFMYKLKTAQVQAPIPPIVGVEGGPAGRDAERDAGGGICFGDSCYTFEKAAATWIENQKSCKAKGGDLVSMEAEDEWAFINSEVQKQTNPTENEWHIGLKKNGDWKWVSGKPLTIEKWQRGQPSGDGPYVVMSKDYPPGTKGLFNDLPDYIPRGSICEKPKGGAQPGGAQPSAQPTTVPGGVTQPGVTQPGGGGAGASPTPPAGGGGATTAPGGGTGATTAPPAGGGAEGMTEFEKDCLNAHNEYRKKHGNPPMKWSQELQKQAQEWANTLAVKNEMEHDMESINSKGVGENLAYFQPGDPSKMPTQCQGPKTATCVQCREMVADWYSEEENYDYNTGTSKGGVILHFTQVVWKDTTELGMATATSANKFFTVARYKPRGNMGAPEEYIKNVPPIQ